RTQGSHGCIRLSVPDSKWIMNHIPDGTKVVIKDN
ncbi:L,D-transpeptidase, partial [Lactobacillus gallinarum]